MISLLNGDDVLKLVRAEIVDGLGVEPEKVTPDSNIIDDLGADSLDIVELVMTLEELIVKNGGEGNISDDESKKIRTVHEAVELVTTRLKIR